MVREFESDVAAMMARRADLAGQAPVDAEVALARGKLALRRRRMATSIATTAAIVVVVGGTALALARPWADQSAPVGPAGSPSGMSTSPTASGEPTPPPGTTANLGPVSACSAVPALSGDIPIDTTLDTEGKQLRLDYSDANGQSHTYVIKYDSDPSCEPRRDIQRVLNDALGASNDVPPPAADLQRVAELFLAFARGDHDSVPADAPIDLYVGGVLAKTIPPEQQGDPRAWQGCPEGGGSYAARDCPISAVTPLDDWAGRIAVASAAPSHPCAHPATLPSSLSAYGAVTLTPDGSLDCTTYFAVQLFVNDVGQIVAANVVWAEP